MLGAIGAISYDGVSSGDASYNYLMLGWRLDSELLLAQKEKFTNFIT